MDSFGYRSKNGTFVGALGRLIRGESDIAVTAYFIKDYSTRDIDFTNALYSDQLCCIVKKQPLLPKSMTPLLNFPAYFWLFIVILCVCAAYLYTKIKYLSNSLCKYRIYISYSQYLIETLLYVFNSPVLRHCTVVLQSERVYIFTLSVLGLILSTVFQSYLQTNMVTQLTWHKDINTMDQLAATNMRIEVRYAAIMDDLFPENVSKTYDILRHRSVLVPYDNNALERMTSSDPFSIPTRRSLVHLDFSHWFQRQELHLIPQCPKTYALAFPIGRHLIFIERFNLILLRLSEGGMIAKWTNEMYRNHTIFSTLTQKSHLLNKPAFLSLADLQFPFYTLIFGIGLSIIAALFEIFGLKVVRFLFTTRVGCLCAAYGCRNS